MKNANQLLFMTFLTATLYACGGGGGGGGGSSSTPQLTVSSPTITEGDTGTSNLDFVVSLTGAASADVTVDYATSNGSATTADNDYVAISPTTLTVPAGSTSATISVIVNNDTNVELDETVNLELSNISSNATLGTTQAVGTIVNNDFPQVSIAPATLPEGDNGSSNMTFTVSMNVAGIGDVTMDYATSDLPVSNQSATVGQDYTLTSGSLTIPEGDTSITIDVPINGDVDPENDETFLLTLLNLSSNARFVSGGNNTTGTILTDDQPLVSINSPTIFEGGQGQITQVFFTVSLTQATSGDVSFNYVTTDGTAISPDDYTTVNGTATIPAGQQSITVPVNIIGDDLPQSNKNFRMTISNISGNAVLDSSADFGVATIIEDDLIGSTPEVSISSAGVREVDQGNTVAMVFDINVIPAATTPITLDYATTTGDAEAGTDYIAIPTTQLTIPANTSSATIVVTVIGDDDIESDETFGLLLSNVSGNASLRASQATGRIIDNDDPTQTLPRINISSSGKPEGDAGTSLLTFDISLTEAATSDVSVDFVTEDISAVAGSDYVSSSGSVTITQGNTSAQVSIVVNGDTLLESDETFRVRLSNLTGNATLSGNIGVGSILNDDPLATITVDNASVAEGNDGSTTDMTFNVSINFDAENPVTFDYVTSDVTATSGTGTIEDDYTPASGTVTIPAGSRNASFSVQVIGDNRAEADETFTVTLSNPSSNAILASNTVTGSIANDELNVGWQEPVLLENDTNQYSSTPRIAMNDNGDATVVWNQFGSFVYASRYIGGVWQDVEQNIGGSNGSQEPQIAMDNTATALAASVQSTTQFYSNEFIAGSGWVGTVEIHNELSNFDLRMEGNASGQAIAVWWKAGDIPNGIFRTIWYSQFTPGAGWSLAAQADVLLTENALQPEVAIDDEGNVFIAWSQGSDIYVQRFNASSGLWESRVQLNTSVLTTSSVEPRITMNANGNAMVVWQDDTTNTFEYRLWANYYTYDSSTQTGNWLSSPVQVEQNSGSAIMHDLAMDPSGNAYVVWRQENTSNSTYDVFANRYDFATSNWRLINGEAIEMATGLTLHPKVDVDATGNAIVAWTQIGDESIIGFANTRDYNIRANRFVLSNNAWEGPQNIESHVEYATNQEIDIAVDAAGNAWVSWTRYDVIPTDIFSLSTQVWAVRFIAP